MVNKRYTIPSASLSQLPEEDLAKLQQKQIVPTNPNPQPSFEEFMGNNIQDLSSRIEYAKDYQRALRDSCRQSLIIKNEKVEEALRELDDIRLELEIEMSTVKRQKRLIIEDMKEGYPSAATLEDAYRAAIRTKITAAKGNANKPRIRQTEFKKAVVDYLQASLETEDGDYLMWCHVSGVWACATYTKTAHIVPKSLESEEIAYVFGTGSMTLDDERNGITILRMIEEALDQGTIVIVPAAEGQNKRWKSVLIDQKKKRHLAYEGVYWQDLDGKELQFRTEDARPASRYLYFRYALTCLHHIGLGQKDLLTGNDTSATWATPRPYLRESMLLQLGKHIGGIDLPEVFYKETTFKESDTRPMLPEDQEDAIAMGLRCRLVLDREEREQSKDSDSDSDSDY